MDDEDFALWTQRLARLIDRMTEESGSRAAAVEVVLFTVHALFEEMEGDTVH